MKGTSLNLIGNNVLLKYLFFCIEVAIPSRQLLASDMFFP